MQEITPRLIKIYDDLIAELELVHQSHQEYLEKVNNDPLHLETEVNKRMAAAQDNLRRLDFAKAERELLQYHHDND